MAPRSKKRALQCQICTTTESKYTCSQCFVVYCSVPCYKKHKESSCQEKKPPDEAKPEYGAQIEEVITKEPEEENEEPALEDPVKLRPLTSLKWPYIPDESAYPDPLKRDDPKTLQLRQYEAIATSPAIRKILSTHKNLPELLKSIDRLRGPDREYALQEALHITPPEIDDALKPAELSEDVLALRELAEAIEKAVRGGNQEALGLDWGE